MTVFCISLNKNILNCELSEVFDIIGSEWQKRLWGLTCHSLQGGTRLTRRAPHQPHEDEIFVVLSRERVPVRARGRRQEDGLVLSAQLPLEELMEGAQGVQRKGPVSQMATCVMCEYVSILCSALARNY